MKKLKILLAAVLLFMAIITISGCGSGGQELYAQQPNSAVTPVSQARWSDSFQPYTTFSVNGIASSVAIGDLIGKNDVILVTSAIGDPRNGRELHIFSGDKISTYKLAGDPTSVEIGDIDGDGKNEIVVPFNEANVQIFYQTPVGFRSDIIQTEEAVKLRVANINDDKVAEIIMVGMKSNKLRIYDRSGRGNLTANDYDIPHSGCKDLAVGDVDGDGLKDIVILDDSGVLVVFQSADYGFYQANFRHIPIFSPTSFAVADINGDGITEIMVAQGISAPHSSITVFKLQGRLFSGVSLPTYDTPRTIKTADINGDGRQDIATLYWDKNYAGVNLQKSDGGFTEEQLYKFPWSWLGFDSNNLALGDINNDGKIDAAIANIDGGLVTLLGK